MKRGDLSQSSFGFNIIERSIEVNDKRDEMTRTVKKAKLFDVSPVTFPAYPQTEVHVRMTTNDRNEVEYFVEDQVIEAVPLKEPGVQPTSDEDLFRQCDDLLNGAFRK